MMFKFINYFLFVLIAINVEAQINNNISDFLLSSLHNVSKNNLSESIYIQTNKGVYETSEDLWFKGYILNNQTLIPSPKSKTLYVQLINNKTNKAVWEEKYSTDNGFVDGHVYVQDTLQEGLYTLAAYSKFSLFDNKQPIKAIRKLQIVNNIAGYHKKKKQDSAYIVNTHKEKEIYFQTFPEGGNLVSGIHSRVAFKAIDENSLPQKVSGGLFENDKKILDIESLHAGMGDFKFSPNHLKHYHIELDSFSHKKKYQLPVIQKTGYSIRLLDNTKDKLRFLVSKNLNHLKENIYLRIQIRGVVYSIAKAILKKRIVIEIPLKGLPQGIAEITLFDKDLQPISERLVYVKQNQKLHISAILDKGEYLTKEEVKLKLKVTDQNGDPVIAHLGLSVFDEIYKNPNDDKTIETHYQLSTQLKGNLYNPSYYFDENNKNRKQALNLLLLTQGWRKYIWNENNLKLNPIKKQPFINTEINGRLFANNKKDKRIIANLYVMAFTADKKSPKHFIKVDSTGRFIVPEKFMQHMKRGYLYLKMMYNNYPNNIYIEAKDSEFLKINQLRKAKTLNYPIKKVKTLSKEIIEPFILSNDVNKLDQVMLKAKKKRVFRDKYMGTLDSLARLRLSNTDYVCSNNILNCINHPFSKRKPIPNNIYMVRQGDQLVEIVYTKTVGKRTYTDQELMRIFTICRIKGYYPKKQFYEPIYNAEEQINGFPDYRNTLYWKPDIITNEQGESTVSFHCSDIDTKFIGVIEGVGENGDLGTESFEFFIRKRK